MQRPPKQPWTPLGITTHRMSLVLPLHKTPLKETPNHQQWGGCGVCGVCGCCIAPSEPHPGCKIRGVISTMCTPAGHSWGSSPGHRKEEESVVPWVPRMWVPLFPKAGGCWVGGPYPEALNWGLCVTTACPHILGGPQAEGPGFGTVRSSAPHRDPSTAGPEGEVRCNPADIPNPPRLSNP